MTVCLSLLIILLTPGIASGIFYPPESVVAFINDKVEFKCEINATIQIWRVNGIPFNQHNTSLRADLKTNQETVGNNELYTLTVPTRAKYNGTVVQCVAIELEGLSTESGNATLLIQGPLSSVGDVSMVSGHNSIFLSWSPPFSLDVTGVDPDIWYTVLISIATNEDNPTAIPCTDCHNLIQPNYTFTTANPSPCHKYSFTVIPQNGAGEGSRSEPVEGAFVDRDVEFDILKAEPEVTYLDVESFSVSLLVTVIGSERVCDYQYMVYIESERNTSTPQGFKSHTTEPLKLLNDSRLEFKVSNLEYDSKYLMTIEGKEEDTKRYNASQPFPLSTFYVQTLSATNTENGSLLVTGRFIKHSPEQGYFLVITSNSSIDRMMAVLNTRSPAVVTGLEPNIYDILVYDVEETGLPNEKPAVEIEGWRGGQDGSLPPTKESLVLNSVIIDPDGDQLNITCHFRNDSSPSKTCVVVIRKFNEPDLMVEFYPPNTNFPVEFHLPKSGSYYVAVFGWNEGIIETFPKQVEQVEIAQGTTPTTEGVSPPSSSELNPLPIVLGIVGFLLIIILCVIVAVVIVVASKYRTKKASLHTGKASNQIEMVHKGVQSDGALNGESVISEQRESLATTDRTHNVKSIMPRIKSDGADEGENVRNPTMPAAPSPYACPELYRVIDSVHTQVHPPRIEYDQLGSTLPPTLSSTPLDGQETDHDIPLTTQLDEIEKVLKVLLGHIEAKKAAGEGHLMQPFDIRTATWEGLATAIKEAHSSPSPDVENSALL